ncbi:unnamed protein product [Cercospora beticola]|nr:unnamed protein product [Cercospora beticola]
MIMLVFAAISQCAPVSSIQEDASVKVLGARQPDAGRQPICTGSNCQDPNNNKPDPCKPYTGCRGDKNNKNEHASP